MALKHREQMTSGLKRSRSSQDLKPGGATESGTGASALVGDVLPAGSSAALGSLRGLKLLLKVTSQVGWRLLVGCSVIYPGCLIFTFKTMGS